MLNHWEFFKISKRIKKQSLFHFVLEQNFNRFAKPNYSLLTIFVP
ncbi:hypothetical protein BACCELL_05223 [Bacteroides cellulosilyticus DSM 14838]|uniref:Uncharacterized protein n=1 Tax=Bacteroides cellulosilyticus DSM 14838 TaxID=537012 RepID=E2NLM9_9BACE|nr:hypothetical protein BACCELL_05223 [Bacteroides cellulosilyticus DSM 14838]